MTKIIKFEEVVMLGSLIDNIKEQVENLINEKTGLSGVQAEKAADIAKNTVKSEVQSEAVKNPSGLLDLLKEQGNITKSNPIIQNISSKYIAGLISKLGLSESIAAKVSDFVIPFIMEKISSKFSSEAKDKDTGGLLNFLGVNNLKEDIGKTMGDAEKEIGDNLKNLF